MNSRKAYQQGRQTILWAHHIEYRPKGAPIKGQCHDSHKQTPLLTLNQDWGSGGVFGWIRIQLSCWIRNQIQVFKVHLNIQISKTILNIFFKMAILSLSLQMNFLSWIWIRI
jgi:hypothetical protein